MEARPLSYLAEAAGGVLYPGGAELLVQGVTTDSRMAKPGELFVALKGERFDGHDFVAEVAARGVAAVAVEDMNCAADLPCPTLSVRNTRQALGKIAARYRADFSIPFIAIGGSNGKTSTKELVAGLLRQGGPVLWSQASFNNDIGVPLTLLRLDRSHQTAVLEVGTNHPGELRPLIEMIRPTMGIVTSLGPEHLEFFETLEKVIEEEGTLAEMVDPAGILIVNGDQPEVEKIIGRARCRVVKVGFAPGNDLQLEWLGVDFEGSRFKLKKSDASWGGEFRTPLLGRHQVLNGGLALQAAMELGLSEAQARKGMAEAMAAPMRLEFVRGPVFSILDDAYNANAASAIAAIETLQSLPVKGNRWMVVGTFAELGESAAAAHAEVGRHAAQAGITGFVTVGPIAEASAVAARESGLLQVKTFDQQEDAAKFLKAKLQKGDLVLLKASRAAHFERLRESLLPDSAAEGKSP